MNADYILQTDVLDLVFENRNKSYGAYSLRKFYASRLRWSLGGMVFFVGVFSAITFLPGSVSPIMIATEHSFTSLPPAKKSSEQVKPKTERNLKEVKAGAKKKSGSPVVVNEKIADSIVVDQFNNAAQKEEIGEPGLTAPPGYADVVHVPEVPAIVKIPDLNEPMRSPEIMPQYPGGMAALRKFLERNLTNPRELGQGERIGVKMQFIVGVDGRLKAFELVEDGGAEFNNEVIRVLKKMPVWIPGKSNGQNVSVYYTIPVKFISED